MAKNHRAEAAVVAPQIYVVPQVADLWRAREAQAAPGDGDPGWKCIQVEQGHVIVPIAQVGSPDRGIAAHSLLRWVAGLVDGDYLIIGQNLFAEMVQGCQVASQIQIGRASCRER